MTTTNKYIQPDVRFPRSDDKIHATVRSSEVLPFRRMSAVEKSKNPTLQKREIKFRARLPKVKTGCQNCKIRRIKCDEKLPGCSRCFKFGILCSGYPKQPEKIKPNSRQIVPILPKGAISGIAQGSIIELYLGPRFTEELDSRYFKHFCENVAAGLAGPLQTSVWSEIIPQVCEIEPYIAHGLVALGAFSKYSKEMTRGGESSDTKKHFEYALREYGKSLRGMQKAIDGNVSRSPRTALIACMLVFCIESLQGHQASASIHATNGIMMLHDYYQASAAGTEFAKENVIGPELRRAFTDLDLQVLHFLDIRPPAHHVIIKEQLNRYHLHGAHIPTFQNIKDSYEYLQMIMRRNLHFIDIARKLLLKADFQEQSTVFSPKDWEGAADLRQNNNPWTQLEPRSSQSPPPASRCTHSSGKMHGEDESTATSQESLNSSDSSIEDDSVDPCMDYVAAAHFPPEILQERDIYLADLMHWEKASESILQECLASPHHSQEFRTAALLKTHAAASAIRLHGTFFIDEIQYDQLTHYFQTIITYCTYLHPYYSTSSYHTNLGILMPLFEVGTHCRARILRDQAIAMSFVSKEYREGSGIVMSAASSVSGFAISRNRGEMKRDIFLRIEERRSPG
ncbi:C6 zinc finger protein [Botrytis cinerea]